uniref:DUF19 domain-containing protein n=1 Tax=Caenorhabditis japonica TaxID=281687 RepID=A0A8R1DIA4_CAEJA
MKFLFILITLPQIVHCFRCSTKDQKLFCSNGICVTTISDVFKKEPFGSPFQHQVIGGSCFNSTLETCRLMKTCRRQIEDCYDKTINFADMCKKVQLFQSSFGQCMLKLQTRVIATEPLDSFLKDFTNYGLARKCILLTEEKISKTLEKGILEECGMEAIDSFKKALVDLQEWFDC